ncbi:MAG TPA: LysR family transcriptional regulator [Woeseiaceae bacterium]|nr:LysR family transcriptional regulator [Woeseiaceae bacterium]
MDRYFCMQVFVRVVEHGAFARAAEALDIARATATEAVAQLEKRLGTRLLHRTTRRLSVTEEGQSYYADCVRILGELAEAEDALSVAKLAPRGRLRISIPHSFVDWFFYAALADFSRAYPELEVEVVLTDRAVNLIEEGIDCAIRGVEVPADSGLVAQRLFQSRWLTCASPAYLARHGTPQSVAELARHDCIRFVSQSTGRPRDYVFDVAGEQVSITPKGRLRMSSFDAVTHTAVAGGGIAQLPDALAYPAVMQGQLTPILAEHVAFAPPLLLVWPGNRYLPARVRVFKEFFADVFPKDGWWSEIAALAKPALSVAD